MEGLKGGVGKSGWARFGVCKFICSILELLNCEMV